MSVHEAKYCPRCGNAFQCNPGNITQCQCYGIQLDENARALIESKYGDCLCAKCLREVGESESPEVRKHNRQ